MTEIQSLARGLKILEILGDSDQGVGVTELAEQMGFDKGTASRMLHTLTKYGYAEKAEDGRSYRLGPMVVRLSRSLINRMPLRDTAKPYLQRLVDATGECAHLAIYSQGKALYIDQVESPETLRVNAEVGHIASLHNTALGKALLAFGDFPISSSLERRTPMTITDHELLDAELERTRQRGFAIDDEEYDIGVRCVAVPVFDFRGKVIGAIGISGPTSRVSKEKLPKLSSVVVQIGQELSDRLRFKRI